MTTFISSWLVSTVLQPRIGTMNSNVLALVVVLVLETESASRGGGRERGGGRRDGSWEARTFGQTPVQPRHGFPVHRSILVFKQPRRDPLRQLLGARQDFRAAFAIQGEFRQFARFAHFETPNEELDLRHHRERGAEFIHA